MSISQQTMTHSMRRGSIWLLVFAFAFGTLPTFVGESTELPFVAERCHVTLRRSCVGVCCVAPSYDE